jgi:hypothetical protein
VNVDTLGTGLRDGQKHEAMAWPTLMSRTATVRMSVIRIQIDDGLAMARSCCLPIKGDRQITSRGFAQPHHPPQRGDDRHGPDGARTLSRNGVDRFALNKGRSRRGISGVGIREWRVLRACWMMAGLISPFAWMATGRR